MTTQNSKELVAKLVIPTKIKFNGQVYGDSIYVNGEKTLVNDDFLATYKKGMQIIDTDEFF